MLPNLDEIKRRRKILGLTQHQLAKNAQISQSMIAKLESGGIEPSYSKAKNIFLALDKLENKTTKKVKDYMTPKIIKVETSQKVKIAIDVMKKYQISQVPVADWYQVVGSISEKTILDKVTQGEEISILEQEKIFEVMDEPFPSVGEDTPINSVLPLLQTNQAILVLKKGKPIGILTKSDILKK